MVLNTATVSLAVTPTVVTNFFSHYLKRAPRRERPTAHLPYDQGLHLVRAFLDYSSQHTVEEVQHFMAQWVPAPSWIRLEAVTIADEHLARAAAILAEQLGPEGLRTVGGRAWWQWRKPNSVLQAEWIEMKSLYAERQRQHRAANLPDDTPARRVMLYVHGGAYYMGSVDEHRYQMQRHARKLRARVFAPRYRLAPQFPFPCGLHDCFAAYLHLLALQGNDASTIVLAGDSAGGGMVLSLLVMIRDAGLAQPAGGILISPWVDLTHSFPSLTGDCPMDYIPQHGFHHKPSMAWPPPSEEQLRAMHAKSKQARAAASSAASSASTGTTGTPANPEHDADDEAAYAMYASNNTTFTVESLDGGAPETITLDKQVQMYTTNNMLHHPLVSPVLQPTLGGLAPLLVVTGGGEILRDEQIYLAHKAADPARYAPAAAATDPAVRALIERYPPTNVQLQVWDDLCHVAPTLSFTRPAKYMYRSIAQFGTWALSRAQNTAMEGVQDDGDISVISESSSSQSGQAESAASTATESAAAKPATPKSVGSKKTKAEKLAAVHAVGRAGDPLPPFVHHMIRQRVTRHGDVFSLPPAEELAGPRMALNTPAHVGTLKRGPVTAWTTTRSVWDARFARQAERVLKKRMADAAAGFETFGRGEHPPPSALAARRRIGADLSEKRPPKANYGMALWSLWGSKHDEATVERAAEAGAEGTHNGNQGNQGNQPDKAESTVREPSEAAAAQQPLSVGGTPLKAHDETYIGASGKRPFVGGIASPFSLNKEAGSASMVTLHSTSGATSTSAAGEPSEAVEARAA